MLVKGLAAFGVGLLLVAFVIGFGYVGFSNTTNAYEVDITAQYQQMKNVYDNGWKTVMETAQISDNYRDDMIKVWQAALTGRYGANGSRAVLQFIKEANPHIDSQLYVRVQDRIDGFHSTFQGAQTKLISEKQEYGRYIKASTEGRFFNMFGNYPHIRCGVPDGSQDDYAILTSDKTNTDFASHEAGALNLRGDRAAGK